MDKKATGGYCYLGDVFVCPKQALVYAEEHELDAYREVTLYTVHGLLHLLGYDDIDPKDRTVMRAKEQKYMKLLEKTGNILCQK
jgi:probable rRNA maturation factor